MSETILQLSAEDVWSALEVIDPVAVLAEELIGRTVGHAEEEVGRLTPWTGYGTRTNASALVALEHPDVDGRCVLPAASLRMFQSAALAAIAARELLVPGGVTVAMLGATQAMQPQLAVIARHVPDISHVAICLADLSRSNLLEARLVDLLELSGIGLSVTTTWPDTVFGANLVVATSEGVVRQDLSGMRVGQLARGAVLVNATGRNLPAELVDRMAEVYVDDFSLLPGNGDRYIVSTHLLATAGDTGVEQTGRYIAADLGQLLAGEHGGREHEDNRVLVELLSGRRLNVQLAYRILQAARRNGLGSRFEL
ncbi:MAG: hypothetical protein GEV28_22950 [Actinophytocola sp.]|uniref:hypothetical protein n=1 Tax=Actinophytocola sp. TaxID=1872138 RepID=UPI00132614F1|nr:hypothetical protein [Actinophytocola sp.]MPZ83092.1 hypothetical protein [Actinophytocola sp.]